MNTNITILDHTLPNPVVSVAMLAYKHEKFIGEALDSVLAQVVDFPIQIVIAEDCSPDSTRAIIEDYQQKYPDIIKLVLQNKNVGSVQNNLTLLANLDGEFVAALEGDDYWLGTTKLQMQVDFLRNNPTYSFCSHRFKLFYQEQNSFDTAIYPVKFAPIVAELGGVIVDKTVYHNNWLTQPLTSVFRKEALLKYNLAMFSSFRDGHVFYLLLQEGNGLCFSDVFGVYRHHSGGIHNGATKVKQAQDIITMSEELYLYSKDVYFFKKYLSGYRDLFCHGKGLGSFLSSFFGTMSFKDKVAMLKFAVTYRKE